MNCEENCPRTFCFLMPFSDILAIPIFGFQTFSDAPCIIYIPTFDLKIVVKVWLNVPIHSHGAVLGFIMVFQTSEKIAISADCYSSGIHGDVEYLGPPFVFFLGIMGS